METLTQIKFERIIHEGFYTILRPIGFIKRGNCFYLKKTELGQLISIQKSTLFSNDKVRFTINTGIFLPEYWRGLKYNKDKTMPTFPTEVKCLVRKRIGRLKGEKDIWYELDEESDETILINEMHLCLLNFVLPYFDKFGTKENLVQFLETEKLNLAPFAKIIVYAELGEKDKAKNEYLAILKKSTDEKVLTTLKEYYETYKLE
jgi:hypothetical protein